MIQTGTGTILAFKKKADNTVNFNELEFLNGEIEEIILAKNSYFAEGFQIPLPQPSGSQTTTGIEGSNPGSGSGGSSSSAPSSGNLDGSCPLNPTPKVAPEVNPFTPQEKKKKNHQCPVDSIGEPSKGPSSEMIINSNHQDQIVIITDRDVKKFMTPEDRKRFDDQIFNENIYKNEIGIRVKYPDEVYTKNYQGKLSTIYLTRSKTGDSCYCRF